MKRLALALLLSALASGCSVTRPTIACDDDWTDAYCEAVEDAMRAGDCDYLDAIGREDLSDCIECRR